MVLIILRWHLCRVQSPFRWRARQEAPLCTSHLRRFLSIAADTNISVAVLFSLRRQDTSQNMCSRLLIIGSGSKQARVRPGREPGSKTCSRPQFCQPRSSSRCTTRTHAPHAQTPQPVSSLCSLFTFTFTQYTFSPETSGRVSHLALAGSRSGRSHIVHPTFFIVRRTKIETDAPLRQRAACQGTLLLLALGSIVAGACVSAQCCMAEKSHTFVTAHWHAHISSQAKLCQRPGDAAANTFCMVVTPLPRRW